MFYEHFAKCLFFLPLPQGQEGPGGYPGPRGRKVVSEIHSGGEVTQRFCWDILFSQPFCLI